MIGDAIEIHPILNEDDYYAALDRIGSLLNAQLSTPEGDAFEALATMIEAYEEEHFPIAMPSPIAAIEFRLDQQGLTRKDLEPMIGSRARVSEIMTGKRQLTLPMIRRLRDGLGIPADVLIGEAKAPARKVRPRKATVSASRRAKPAAAKRTAARP